MSDVDDSSVDVPIKPYLIRAIHEWCTDQGYTPYLAVAVDAYTQVPREHVRDGQIVLNVSLGATHQLTLGNDEITFSARFNGVARPLLVPVANVAAIYARENGQGMAFEPVTREAEPELVEESAPAAASTEDAADTAADTQGTPEPAARATPTRTPQQSHLKRIK